MTRYWVHVSMRIWWRKSNILIGDVKNVTYIGAVLFYLISCFLKSSWNKRKTTWNNRHGKFIFYYYLYINFICNLVRFSLHSLWFHIFKLALWRLLVYYKSKWLTATATRSTWGILRVWVSSTIIDQSHRTCACIVCDSLSQLTTFVTAVIVARSYRIVKRHNHVSGLYFPIKWLKILSKSSLNNAH